ncbi:MAG: EAL domain-containing protein [Magnetococcales bacterium]|nr:EAL domain-containing protein [Magnetococcales bacterium]
MSGTHMDEDLCRHLFDRLPDGLLIHRSDQILFANDNLVRLSGLEGMEELLNRSLSSLLHPESRVALEQFPKLLKEEAQDGNPTLEMKLAQPGRKSVAVEMAFSKVSYQGEEAIFSVVRDITRRKEEEAQIRHQANYDPLTGLPNRALFLDRLTHDLKRAKRTKSRTALMFIDLDRFKWVNDTLGHSAGDQLLKEVSERLLECHRKSDTVARLGGDEFTVILPDMAKGPFAERVAGQILEALARPFMLAGQEAFISGSVGITIFPDDADNVADLLKNADSAMYRAKSDGRNAYRFFTPDMHAEAQERMELEKDLHKALGRGELVIHYQPIVDLDTYEVKGAEALLRWHHPKRGNVAPDVFVQVAEEISLIGPITEWALEEVCAKNRQWRDEFGLESLFISVNLTCTRCRDLTIDEKIPHILEKTGLPADGLRLEITENIIMEEEDRAMSMLSHLVHQGVALWLDDFGTGFSSLSVLKKLPVAGVKVDRIFVAEAMNDREASVLVEAIISLANSLNRDVIGEGVEGMDQALYLRERGCHLAQGYYFGKPMAHEEFEYYLKEHIADRKQSSD